MQKLLILGTGGMAHTHAAAFAAIPDCKIVVAVDNNPDNLAQFCAEFGVETRFNDLADAIAWGEFDAALNVTPDPIHHPTTMALIAAGKHVFCEKPLAETYPLAKEMADGIEAKNLVGMVNLTYRNSAGIQLAHELVRDGEIGEVRHFEASYRQSWLVGNHWGDWQTEQRWLWRLSEAHGSLGVLGDVGIHILDFAGFAANSEVAEISCKLKTFHKAENDRIGDYPLDANDSAIMNIELKNGALGVIHASRFATGYANALKLVVHGTKGAVRVDLDQSWDHLDICRGDNVHTQAWERIKAPDVKTNYARFIDALNNGQTQDPSFRTAANLQKVLDLCVESDGLGKTIQI
ncbi:MAG: oxidoreductase [Hyphomicrobiales bacterium]|nr:MAG: oxidoreductase [Hyphomicrobiales bacterium]